MDAMRQPPIQKHGPLNLQIFNDPMFMENGFLLWCDDLPDCWLIDPGLPPQEEGFIAAIEQHGLTRRAILLTHAHADHIAGVISLRESLPDAPVICPKAEVQLMTDSEANLSAAFGFPIELPEPDQTIEPGETLSLGSLSFSVLDVSGHSPGGVAYYCEQVGIAIVGDSLFSEGIGRTDFPTSNHADLIRNIQENLLTLPADTLIYPGHGPAATIAQIMATNLTLLGEIDQ